MRIKLTVLLVIFAAAIAFPVVAAQPASGSNGAVKSVVSSVILPGDEIKLSVYHESDL